MRQPSFSAESDIFERMTTKNRVKNSLRISLLLGILIGFSGCASDTPESMDSGVDVGSPPSVSENARGIYVNLDSEQMGQMTLETIEVVSEPGVVSEWVNGLVYPAPGSIAHVSAPVSGRVTRILAHEGEAVRKGQVLLEIESMDLANLAADYLQAKAELAYREKESTRLEMLVLDGIGAQKDLDRAVADLARAEAALRAASTRISATGIGADDMEKWESGEVESPVLQIRAPIGGLINEHLVELGQAAEAYQTMLDIVNPNQVFIEGFVPPGLAKDVRPGQVAGVAPNDEADVNRSGITAVVRHILPSLDEDQRAARVLFSAEAPGGWPKSGQQVRLALEVPTARAYVRLPLEAIEFEGQEAFVFVKLAPDRFEKRSVDLAEVGDNDVLVASGLTEGELVVTTQVFSLKALSKFEEYAE